MEKKLNSKSQAGAAANRDMLPIVNSSADIAANPVLGEVFDFIMTFGKHKGEKLVQILDKNPSYIIWLAENEVVKIPSDLLAMAFNDTMAPDYEDLHNDWGCRD